MTDQTYIVTLRIIGGTELDITLDALANSDLMGRTIETIEIRAER